MSILPFNLSIIDLPNCELLLSVFLLSNFCKKTMIDTIHFISVKSGIIVQSVSLLLTEQ